MKITWKKALRDCFLFKGRTFVTFLGILIGIASFGAVLSAYTILDREMTRNFMDTNPASMVFTIPNLDARAAGLVKENWPDTGIEVKKTIQARVARGDGTYGTIYLRATRTFKNRRLIRFPSNGAVFQQERMSLRWSVIP